jgi:hypothetical protein
MRSILHSSSKIMERAQPDSGDVCQEYDVMLRHVHRQSSQPRRRQEQNLAVQSIKTTAALDDAPEELPFEYPPPPTTTSASQPDSAAKKALFLANRNDFPEEFPFEDPSTTGAPEQGPSTKPKMFLEDRVGVPSPNRQIVTSSTLPNLDDATITRSSQRLADGDMITQSRAPPSRRNDVTGPMLATQSPSEIPSQLTNPNDNEWNNTIDPGESSLIDARVMRLTSSYPVSVYDRPIPWSVLLRQGKVIILLLILLLLLSGLVACVILLATQKDNPSPLNSKLTQTGESGTSSGGDSPRPTIPPSLRPSIPSSTTVVPSRDASPSTSTPTSVNQDIINMLALLSPDGGTALAKDSTPQRLAADFVLSDPNLRSYSNQTIIQRFALATLYYMAQKTGPGYVFEKDNLDASECDWTGVWCYDGVIVHELLLNETGMRGQLPEELGMLTNVQWLVLWGNALTGTIPDAFSRLTDMRGLSVVGNLFTGTFPNFLFLPKLSYLDISWCQTLKVTLTSEIAQAVNLVNLNMNNALISGGIPDELYRLSALETINLEGTLLSGTLSTMIGQMSSLVDINLSDNGLSGPIPSELGLLSNLFLIVSKNQFSGRIPSELGSNTKLYQLDLSTNILTGSIPSELVLLTGMSSWFGLARNQLTGTMHTEFGSMVSLNLVFEVDNNLLSGRIPTELGKLTGLRSLALHSNNFSGPVPSEFGNLKLLTSLSLEHNLELTGTIPTSWADMGSLTSLTMYNNKINGTVSSAMCAAFTTLGTTISADCDFECSCCGPYCF